MNEDGPPSWYKNDPWPDDVGSWETEKKRQNISNESWLEIILTFPLWVYIYIQWFLVWLFRRR